MTLFSSCREAAFLVSHPRLWFRKPLEATSLDRDPFKQFSQWYAGARSCWTLEFANAMTLSTVDSDGYPDARVVLLKEFNQQGFVFYTNSNSQKGRQLQDSAKAHLTFYWGPLQRQVRIKGDVELVDETQADKYFAGRPRESQIGAWASEQSSELSGRGELIEKAAQLRAKFAGGPVPRPPHWNGYRVVPKVFEFWELRLSRLHDRFEFVREDENSEWIVRRLSP